MNTDQNLQQDFDGQAEETRIDPRELAFLKARDERTINLVKCYQACLTEFHPQYQYPVFSTFDIDAIRQDKKVAPKLKQFETVREWWESQGCSLCLADDTRWQDYVRYVFRCYLPMSPRPGQLKNEVLVKDWASGSVTLTPKAPGAPQRSLAELRALYAKVTDQEVVAEVLASLNLPESVTH